MRSVLNSKIYIGGIVDPAAEVDASSFAGADWVEIDGWTDRGPPGDVQAVGTQSRINRRRILKYKTTRSVSAMENQFVPLPLDPGQIRLKQAVASCRPYQFRIDTPGECGEEPSIVMFVALVLPGTRQGGPTEAAHIRSWSIAPLSNIYEYPAMFLNAIFANNSALRSLRQNADGTGDVHAPGTPIGMAVDQSGHGNDALQAVGTARPQLRVMPRGGVRNLLAQVGAPSEDFAGAGWTRQGVTATDEGDFINGYPAQRINLSVGDSRKSIHITPFQGSTDSRVAGVVIDVAGLGTRYAALVFYNGGRSAFAFFTWTGPTTINVTGAVTGHYEVLGDYKAKLWGVLPPNASTFERVVINFGAFGDYNSTPGEYVLLTRWQANEGATLAPYQQVISQHEIHQSGVPDIYAPLFDGADDWLGNTLDAPVDIAQTGAMIACVCQVSALGVSQSPIALANTTSTDGLLRFLVDSVGNASLNADPTDGSATVSPPFAGLESATELRILVGILQPDGTVRVRINGSEDVASAKVTSSIVVDRFSIGVTQRNTPITFFNGTIPESLFKIGTVSDAQIEQLERQWSDKYGVALA